MHLLELGHPLSSLFVAPRRTKYGPGPDEVRRVLTDLDIPSHLRPDLLLEVGDQILLVEVKNRVTESDVGGVVAQMRKHARAARADGVLVVADRISMPARDVLSSSGIGWLDRRGHLRMRWPGLLVDSDVPPLVAEPTERVVDLFSATGCDVAMALVLSPADRLGTMEIAHRIERSAGRASELLAAMRNAGLVESTGTTPDPRPVQCARRRMVAPVVPPGRHPAAGSHVPPERHSGSHLARDPRSRHVRLAPRDLRGRQVELASPAVIRRAGRRGASGSQCRPLPVALWVQHRGRDQRRVPRGQPRRRRSRPCSGSWSRTRDPRCLDPRRTYPCLVRFGSWTRTARPQARSRPRNVGRLGVGRALRPDRRARGHGPPRPGAPGHPGHRHRRRPRAGNPVRARRGVRRRPLHRKGADGASE